MNDRRTDWAALLAALVSFISVGIIVWIAVSFFGCTAAPKGNAAGVNVGPQVSAERIELLESALVSLDRKLEIQAGVQQDATGGRDVTINDPWTGRIAVLGLAGIPASFLLYLLSKRVPLARKVYDALSGKPCAERQAGRCVPSQWREAAEALEAMASRETLGPQDDAG